MSRYIVQMRRGTAEQWANSNIVPFVGELVVEIDEKNNLHKLKIGDGVHEYSELAYLTAGDEIVTQVLAKALPRVVTITLDVDKWEKVTNETDPNLGYYRQSIELDKITNYSRLDLQPDADMLAEFKTLNLVFVTENKNGNITVYSVGDMPLKTYAMQATIVETDVIEADKIIGTPVNVSISGATKPTYKHNVYLGSIYGADDSDYEWGNIRLQYYSNSSDKTITPQNMASQLFEAGYISLDTSAPIYSSTTNGYTHQMPVAIYSVDGAKLSAVSNSGTVYAVTFLTTGTYGQANIHIVTPANM